ncbi:hypothetical protein D1641_14600 [Colidextribacter sp. OB.20]|uniref:hypothetical protein n=1 Tax=Colidextribacter sp. OB.20 TaxID=2304568 RepID=UPI001367B66E|nr:hypothetical protein [Colidextribacter sp. OB.20]NBI11227.1 hypothetical protein [Colidextribacter sp. OB.20]
MEKTCFFIGHRDAPDSLAPELDALVERHITEYGVGEFVVGRYGGFDALAASAVKRAKARRPDVRLVCLRPYHPAERPEKTPSGFDGSFYPPGMERVPRKLAIVRANRYMVDTSDCLIAYAWHPGNACELAEYAQRRAMRGLLRVVVLGRM